MGSEPYPILPPKNTYIKYRITGENQFKIAKTSNKQPKPNSKNRIYVNMKEKEKDMYSVKWDEVDEWMEIEDEDQFDENHLLESQGDESQSVSANDDTPNDMGDYRNPEDETNESSEDDLSIDENDETIPPYQPQSESSSHYESLDNSELNVSHRSDSQEYDQMSQSMSNLSISKRRRLRKITPMKDKIKLLKKELEDEKEKTQQLEEIVEKMSIEDESGLRKQLADTMKTLDIYKDEVRKRLENDRNECGRDESSFEIHPNTARLFPRKKSDILNINSNLNKKITKLEEEKSSMNKAYEKLSKELEAEKDIHRQFDILQLEMFNANESNPEKIIFEAEQKLQRKQTEIENVQRQLEESKYQITEKLREITNLQRVNHELFTELSQRKEMNEKDKTIQQKNEDIIALLKEKAYNNNVQMTALHEQMAQTLNEQLNQKRKASQSSIIDLEQSAFIGQQRKVRQGLPNERNFCFIISVMHSLAVSISGNELPIDDPIPAFLKATKNCIEGHQTPADAEKLIEDLWVYIKSNWPNYEQEHGQTGQECAAEFIRRLTEKDDTLNELSKLYIKSSRKCFNDKCDVLASETKKVTNIIKHELRETVNHTTLQEILDSHIGENDETPCHMCLQETQTISSVKKAPNLLIFEIPRATANQQKANITITDWEKGVIVKENNEKVNYQLKAVVVHRGELSENGHYIVNYFNNRNRRWEQIDDDNVIAANDHEIENGEGAIYILKRQSEHIKDDSNGKYEKSKGNQHNERKEPNSYRDALKRRQEPNYNANHRENRQVISNNRNNKGHYKEENPSIDYEEQQNIKRKKNNIIVKGLEENGYEGDLKEIININRAIGNSDFNRNNILKVERIGEYQNQPRPLKVVLDTSITKIQIMRNAKNLRNCQDYGNISIQHDLTVKQMIYYKELVAKSIEMENKYKDQYIFRVRGPPGQWEIKHFPKNYQ